MMPALGYMMLILGYMMLALGYGMLTLGDGMLTLGDGMLTLGYDSLGQCCKTRCNDRTHRRDTRLDTCNIDMFFTIGQGIDCIRLMNTMCASYLCSVRAGIVSNASLAIV